MQDFVRKRIMLAKTWAKFERMELTDLRQRTSGISEATFSALKWENVGACSDRN
jgi:hypothetical protein